MHFFRTTPAERAAKHFGQRKHDKVEIETHIAALVGAGVAATLTFEQTRASDRWTALALVYFAGSCGLVIGGALARVYRTREPRLVGYLGLTGVVLAAGLVIFAPEPPSTAAPTAAPAAPVAPDASSGSVPDLAPISTLPGTESGTSTTATPGTTEPEVASAGPVPPEAVTTTGGDESAPAAETTAPSDDPTVTDEAAAATSSTTPVSSTTQPDPIVTVVAERSLPGADRVSCTIDVRGTQFMPTAGCGGQVTVSVFGAPASGPSAWHLPMHVDLILDAPDPDGSWLRVTRVSTTSPVCVTEDETVATNAGALEPIAPERWMEQVRVVELRDAPLGTVVTLWAACADPVAGIGIDPTSGWVITAL